MNKTQSVKQDKKGGIISAFFYTIHETLKRGASLSAPPV
jgi:hypothetical protein